MKRLSGVKWLLFLSVLCWVTQANAQHFISIQSADKQAFAIQLNGRNFASSKTGSLRVANLSAGNYNIVVNPTGKKYPPQQFTCVIDKTDMSYTLVNDAKKGWVLNNNKSPEVLLSATYPGSRAPAQNPVQPPSAFAAMLAQVINDPDLLKPTPWVLTTKVETDEKQDMANAMAEAESEDTSSYVSATKGMIKASETEVKGGTEMVFVDFNAEQGDTIHIFIPAMEGDSTAVAETVQQPALNSPAIPTADTTAVMKPHDIAANGNTGRDTTVVKATVKKEEAVAPFDTSANRQFNNPFFKKDNADAQPGAGDVTANTAGVNAGKAGENMHAGTKEGDVEKNVPVQQQTADVAKSTVKTDCKKMLSDNEQEKLKHKIYLETDQDKILSLTRKALDGRCISTAQVKELASFFLSDDSRYSFFYTVYPYVYDFGNFASLKSYMIDAKYKNMFEDMLK
ncbi:MAG TPA: DUF4476 domain-containing protein [Chitinophagaceae bacterium]|nr:DUF4476 domain-containing protein [Chitinophagaceae bacterium]